MLYLSNLCRVLLILATGNAVGMFKRSEVVHVFKEAVKACPVAGGQPFIAHRVFHIFNTVTAKNKRPICLSIGFILIENLLINAHSLIKLIVTTEMVCSVIEVRSFLIIELG